MANKVDDELIENLKKKKQSPVTKIVFHFRSLKSLVLTGICEPLNVIFYM